MILLNQEYKGSRFEISNVMAERLCSIVVIVDRHERAEDL